MDIYKHIDNIDSKSFFMYLVIFLLIIFFFKDKPISHGGMVGSIFALFIIIYLNGKRISIENTEKEQHQHKSDQIRPYKKELFDYVDITDFIYSINELYYYNPQAFEDLVDEFVHFIKVYENCKKVPTESHALIDIANIKKHNILNSLHSIIFNIPPSDALDFKLEDSLRIVEYILNKYMEEIYKITQEDLHNSGYTNKYKIHDLGPKAGNFYQDKDFTFEFF